MFSLRSNSIESRFTRFLGQFFGFCFRAFWEKQKQDQKQLGIRFAHEFFCSLRSVYAQWSACDLRSFRLHCLKKRFFREPKRKFSSFARRHSLCNDLQDHIKNQDLQNHSHQILALLVQVEFEEKAALMFEL